MHTRKMLLIGVDGMDPNLLKEFASELPHFTKIMNGCSTISIASTFPPDSICAWSSIYTGLNPAEHGIVDSLDYLDAKKFKNFKVDQGVYKGKTFWDELGKSGKKVIIINPFLAYPAWEVNGIMVSGPVFEGGKVSLYPESIDNKYALPELGGIVDFPDRAGLNSFYDRSLKNTQELFKFSMDVLCDNPWDFAFISFLTLDRIKHFFWRYHDENDPAHPVGNEFKLVIKNLYREYDRLIGAYIDRFSDAKIVVLSDHGHGRRCIKCFNLNEFLRTKNYLVTKTKHRSFSPKVALERTKMAVLRIVDKFELHDFVYKIVKYIPHRRELKKSSYLIDKEKSTCFTSEIFGTNPFGGIEINNAIAAGQEYDSVRNKIIDELRVFNETANIFKWVKKREDMYAGVFIKKYPDILFELQEDYGVNWSVFCDLITPNPMHKKISGGHKNEATFLKYPCADSEKSGSQNVQSILHIKRYILDFFNARTQ